MGCGILKPGQVDVAQPEPSPSRSPPRSPPKNQRRRFSLEKTVASVEDIRKVYKFDPKVIGHGHFGSVRVGTSKNDPSMRYAIKTIQKEKIKGDLHWLTREVEILKCLHHPNVIRFYETYQDEKFFHIVMEYCTGGELLEWIVESGRLDEHEAANVMKKIFSAVSYLHEHGICHRDLKLENFLFADRSKNAEIKIIDFGLSNKFGETEEKYLSTKVGTPLYVAPEVLKGKYNEACDIWSLGVVLFMLLSGKFPFFGENNDKIFKQILAGRYNFQERVWNTISSEAKDLISKLLAVDSEARLTAAEALKHPWFAKSSNNPDIRKVAQPIDPSVIDNLKRYNKAGKFKREALKIVVRMMRDNEITEMNEAFRALDKEGTGIIKISDVNKVMHGLGLSKTESELNKIISDIAVDTDEFNYIEFISASMNQKKSLTKGKLWTVFKHFAIDEHNYITKNNLTKAMERSGRKIPEEDLDAMIKEIDKNNEGKISYEQFCHMMMSGKIEEDVDKSIDVISDISSPRRRGSLFDEPNFQMTAINLQKLAQMAEAIQQVKDEDEEDSDKASKVSKAASVKNVAA